MTLPPSPPTSAINPFERFCQQHYATAAVLILVLAAFNLTFRLDHEFLDEWDEALYAISAWEMLSSGQWAATTFHGALDYYNSKPPLNVWAIAISLEAFGPSLVTLRLPSVLCAWSTVLVLLLVTRRWCGHAVSLCAALVLATCFGFLYVHAGRSANCDAAFTLIVVLTVTTLVDACGRPQRAFWLGPLLAAAFLLKGFGALLPATIIAIVLACRRDAAWRRPLAAAATGFALPVAAWAAARWQVDGVRFFAAMVQNDLISITTTAMDGHRGHLLYYANVLQKHHYDWLVAAVVAVVISRPRWPEAQRWLMFWRPDAAHWHLVLGAWTVAALAIPTLMQTKLAWYLNPFYPAFAICVALLLVRCLSRAGAGRSVMALLLCSAFVVAEGKAVWYSYAYRDLEWSRQGLLLRERERLRGSRVYQPDWTHADRFVLTALVGGVPESHDDRDSLALDGLALDSAPLDYVLAPPGTETFPYEVIGCQLNVCLYGNIPRATTF